MAKCEDYPCCGHTDQDPCERQWYDEPSAFDTSKPGNEHALCDHEAGICDVYEDVDDDEEEFECDLCSVTTPHTHDKVKWDDTRGLVPDEGNETEAEFWGRMPGIPDDYRY
jgi:hypothetical protein